VTAPVNRSWPFTLAAAIPAGVLLLYCAVGLHEWWLIASGQIAVIPAPKPGDTSMPEVPAASLLPLIFVAGAMAAGFIWAWLRGSRRILQGSYLALLGLIALAMARHALMAP
jgi:hypothetical protein